MSGPNFPQQNSLEVQTIGGPDGRIIWLDANPPRLSDSNIKGESFQVSSWPGGLAYLYAANASTLHPRGVVGRLPSQTTYARYKEPSRCLSA